ncbi:MAG TPA: Fic family protein [Pseudomonadota bacterium]|jgi:Fic family protein|nr:Fic family protein [Pseudomonadota bacterium]
MQRQTGRNERTHFGGEEVAAFVPEPLPPQNPPLTLDGALLKRLHRAEDALRRLDLAGEMVPSLLPELLSALEKYIHHENGLPPLVRAGLLHVQFETIHPYLDGNGRIGRLLVTLLLEHWKLLTKPLLYLSLFLKRHRTEYYRLLNAVRKEGEWEPWIDFFLNGVATISEEATNSARDLFALVATDRERVLSHDATSVAAIRLFEALPRHPIVSVATAMRLLQTSKPTATRAIEALIDADVLQESTGKKRDRSFAYHRYLERLRDGTETG